MFPRSIPRVTILICLWFLPFSFLYTQITGLVVDRDTQQPISGANIIILNTDIGITTNDKGMFVLNWKGEFPIKIRVSHIGYSGQDIAVQTPGEVLVNLELTVLEGTEIFITGERKKIEREVSSSVEDVSLEQIEIRGIRDIGEVLQEMSSVVISTAPSGRQTASVRGSNANEISVYLDGIRLNRLSLIHI